MILYTGVLRVSASFYFQLNKPITGHVHLPGSSSSKCHILEVTLTDVPSGKAALNRQQMPHKGDNAAQEKLDEGFYKHSHRNWGVHVLQGAK